MLVPSSRIIGLCSETTLVKVRTITLGSPENLARGKWVGPQLARFGPARAQPGMTCNGPRPARSTARHVNIYREIILFSSNLVMLKISNLAKNTNI
jgi:hypothetical protein